MLSVLSTLPLGYLELLGNLPPQLQAILSTLKPPIHISTISVVVCIYRRVFSFSDVIHAERAYQPQSHLRRGGYLEWQRDIIHRYALRHPIA